YDNFCGLSKLLHLLLLKIIDFQAMRQLKQPLQGAFHKNCQTTIEINFLPFLIQQNPHNCYFKTFVVWILLN
ncbi:MAG: hypothetical protein ACKVTZ_22650, partial [Bacteroidia bacterium]